MKQKSKIGLITGFILLIMGLILASIGFFSGGLKALETMAEPITKTETFEGVKSLELGIYDKYIKFTESPDQKVHVSYAYYEQGFHSKISLKQEGSLLTLVQELKNRELNLPLTSMAQDMNSGPIYHVEVALPKGMVLEKLSGTHFNGNIDLSNLHIKEIDFSSSIYGDNVTIDGGSFAGGELKNSTLKNVDLQLYSTLTLTDSQLENAKVSWNDWLTIENSKIKNSQFTGEHASFVANKTSLENTQVSIKAASIEMSSASFVGDNSLETHNAEIILSLAPDSLKKLNLSATILADPNTSQGYMDELSDLDFVLGDKIPETSYQVKDDQKILTLKAEGAKDSVSLKTTNHNITID